MANSKAYTIFLKQIRAIGYDKKDGYYANLFDEIYECEREEIERLIWNKFTQESDVGLVQFIPRLKNYNGIDALLKSDFLYQIPSYACVETCRTLYEYLGDGKFLDIIKENIDMCPNEIGYVSTLSECRPSEKLKDMLMDIFINNPDSINRNTAFMGLLHIAGVIKDLNSIDDVNSTIELRRRYKSDKREERIERMREFDEEYLNSIILE